ncbi:hypothetical protein [Streptacidiphilus anmyonensis]|uniref:hypothetical protein n=1 Tax=Streptacidiphilus anmyonensis TaxID=405782 RepID=UPI0005A79CA2|nr:hypothetical protein [Streptacidiphilus anmyonensis]
MLLASGGAAGVGGYSVGWLTLSLINAGLAQGKGRSGLNWWLLSLVLGPLATLLVVIRPPAETPAVQALMDLAIADAEAEAEAEARGEGGAADR